MEVFPPPLAGPSPLDQSNDATRRVLDALERWASGQHDDPRQALARIRALCDPAVTEQVFLGRAIEHAMVAGNVANLETLRDDLAACGNDWVSHALMQGHATALAWLLEQPLHRQSAQQQLPWACNHLVREAALIDGGATVYKSLSVEQLSTVVGALASLPGFPDQLHAALEENRESRQHHGFGAPPSGPGMAVLQQLLLNMRTAVPQNRQCPGPHRL